MFEQFIPRRPSGENTFWLTQGLLKGSKLKIGYRAWTKTMQVEQVLTREGVELYQDRESAAKAVLNCVKSRFQILSAQSDALMKAHARVWLTSRKRKALKQQLEESLKRLEDVEDRLNVSPFQVPYRPCAMLEHMRGHFLGIHSVVPVIRKPQGDELPTLEIFRVYDFEHRVGEDLLYFLCVSDADPDQTFRLCSDYLLDNGTVFLPGAWGEQMLAFWDMAVAEDVLNALSPLEAAQKKGSRHQSGGTDELPAMTLFPLDLSDLECDCCLAEMEDMECMCGCCIPGMET